MELIQQIIHSIATSIGPMLLLLGVLIFVHEFGHFIVAKYFGVRVEVFCLGFGKKIIQRKWGDTTYCIAMIPLGGYVKMFGDDPSKDIPEEEKKHSFLHQKVLPKIAIVLAGPLINLVFAFFIFMAVVMIGEKTPSPALGIIEADTVAASLGFKTGDTILEIDNKAVTNWTEIKSTLENSANKNLNFKIKRELGGEIKSLSATPKLSDNENIISDQSKVGMIEGLSILSNAPTIGVIPDGFFAKAGIESLTTISKINDVEILFYRQLNRVFNSEAQKGDVIKVEYYLFNETKPNTVDVTVNTESGKEFDAEKFFGFEVSHLYLMNVKKDSPASKAGLISKDKIVSINGKELNTWEQVLNKVKAFDPKNNSLTFGVLRQGSIQQIKITPEMTTLMTRKGQEESRYTIGIAPAYFQSMNKPVIKRILNPFSAFAEGVRRSIKWTKWTIVSFVRLAEGRVSIKNVGGVISIGKVASQSYDAGMAAFLKIMAIISVNLFILNLLPVPVLDGGHLIFFIIEGVKGSPLSLKKMEIAQTFGLVMLMLLMSFAIFNDVVNWFDGTKW